MSSYSKKKSCDFVVTAENTGKVLALSQRFLPDALYCFTLKHFSNLLKKEDCTVGANVSKKSKGSTAQLLRQALSNHPSDRKP